MSIKLDITPEKNKQAEKCSQYFIFRTMPKDGINNNEARCTRCLWPRLNRCANVCSVEFVQD